MLPSEESAHRLHFSIAFAHYVSASRRVRLSPYRQKLLPSQESLRVYSPYICRAAALPILSALRRCPNCRPRAGSARLGALLPSNGAVIHSEYTAFPRKNQVFGAGGAFGLGFLFCVRLARPYQVDDFACPCFSYCTGIFLFKRKQKGFGLLLSLLSIFIQFF